MNKEAVAKELTAVAELLTADWFDEDNMKSEAAIKDFIRTLETIQRDIARASSELRAGKVGINAAHLAASLAGGAYTEGDWYQRLFK